MTMTQPQPSETLQEWQRAAKYWAKHRNTIRTMFTPLTSALIEEAGILHGHSVLDVAGGPGEPSLTIAETVGPEGAVTCTDAVSEMVAAAEEEGRSRGLTNVQFRQCTADSLPFSDGSFDVVVSRLGAMFFPDPLAALREMLRVTKPGGTVALAVWGKTELNPFAYLITEIIARHVETPPLDPGAPGAFRFADAGKLADILQNAGATDVRERILKFDIAAPISPEEFWEMRSETSETLRAKLVRLSAEERSKVGSEVADAVREFFAHNRMRFPAQMIIVTGKALAREKGG